MLRTHIGYGSPNKQDTHEGARLAARRGRGAPDQGGLRLGPGRPLPRARTRCSSTSGRPPASAARRPRPSGTSAPRPTAPSIPTLWDELSLVMEGRLPDGWDAELPRFRPTTAASPPARRRSQVIQWAAAQRAAPGQRLGRPRAVDAHRDRRRRLGRPRATTRGRNVHYGVREHGMGAIVNGLNLHGLRAFGSTFFNFSDYMKGADAAGGAHAPAGDLRLHPRLDRARRGRADPPADRAAGAPARHAEPLHGPAGRSERDRAGLALRARARRTRRSPSR